MSSPFFDNRPFGIIREKAHLVYARTAPWTFTRITDSHREADSERLKNYWSVISGEVIDESSMSGMETNVHTSTEHPGSVLTYFYKVHQFARKFWGKPDMVNLFTREMKFSDILFLEVNSFLSAEMEYLLMIYMGLLGMGLKMPQLFVIVDYPTDAFDFIATDILKVPVVPWTLPPNPKGEDIPYPDEIGIEPRRFVPSGYRPSDHAGAAGNPDKVHIIISGNNLYRKVMEKDFISKPGKHVILGFQSYEDQPAIAPGDDETFYFIIVDSAETVLKYLRDLPERQEKNPHLKSLRCDVIIIDEYTRMRSNAHYSNNIPLGRLQHQNYIRSRVWELMNAFTTPPSHIYLHQSERSDRHNVPSIRETLERNAINDFLTMTKYNISMTSLYTMHYKPPGSRAFLSSIRSHIEVLKDLGYNDPLPPAKKDDNGNPLPEELLRKSMADKLNQAPFLRVHPIMIAFIDEWFNRGLPKMDILVFVAVASTPIEYVVVRQAGSREHKSIIDSEFARSYEDYLQRVAEWNHFTQEGGGKTSDQLRRLIKEYEKDLEVDGYGMPDFANFSRFFIKMVKEKFSRMILTRSAPHEYHSVYDLRMKWTINAGGQAPIRILPLDVRSHANGKHVRLFVPLD